MTTAATGGSLMPPSGRLLGIDPGRVRIGLAITDPDRRLASPLDTYTRQTPEQDARFFLNLIQKEDVTGLVVGLPVHNDGREGEQALAARSFGELLSQTTGLPVVFFDERFTTVQAEEWLLSAGLTNKKRKARRDRVAAQIMLQSYLEANTKPDSGK